ncbi:hypothetical protein ElyMa_006204000 [Elysia marginata]|uniref:SMB domain-containing protein n=1 Tax=Elysia marginata TaxID=1093978 RepID=A0AAV4H7B2_9GAST|nr:hypothetical protein ElyMa_006204000 [Elysia marginata]
MSWDDFEARSWYPKDLRSLNGTGLNNTEIEESFRMLGESALGARSIFISKLTYKLMPTDEMRAVLSGLGLCAQGDILTRISCRNRCGELPDTRRFPAQCACDEDCFLYGDCCEDMDQLCADTFVKTVSKHYNLLDTHPEPGCYQFGYLILSNLYQSEKTKPSAEPTVTGIDCEIKLQRKDVFKNIGEALLYSMCHVRNSKLGQPMLTRACDRPDVLACRKQEDPNQYHFYPVHNLCHGTPLTRRLANRYYIGPHDMEVVSHHDNCLHLRQAAPGDIYAYAQNNRIVPGNLWHQNQFEKIKVTTTSIDGQTYFNFETKEWRRVSCKGGLTADAWKCQENKCSEGELYDDKNYFCYRPDYAYLEVATSSNKPELSKKDSLKFHDMPGSSNNTMNKTENFADKSKGQDTNSYLSKHVVACSCFKVQALFNSIGWWQVFIDTSQLLHQRCSFYLYSSLENHFLL